MTAAVDTNVLLDLLIPDAPNGDESEQRLNAAARDGRIIISEVVYAELAASFDSQSDLDSFIDGTGLHVEASGRGVLHRAGVAWRQYSARRPTVLLCPSCGAEHIATCERCGLALRSRQHVLADFLIGAHASAHADRLLTRDRGYYSTYFPELRLD